jgi:ABC-type sugar transport system ATPase subunit
MICELARSGLAIILISSELPEIINLCDRVIIMASGKIVGELGREELTEERILKLAMSES